MSKTPDYFDLAEHDGIQLALFFLLFLVGTLGTFFLMLLPMESFLEHYLLGKVYYSGEALDYLIDEKTTKRFTNWYTNWAIDIYLDTPSEARNWINPIQVLIAPSLFLGFLIAFFTTVLLPTKLGLIRQKIEREIISELDKLTLKINGVHDSSEREKIMRLLLDANLKNLHDYNREWNIEVRDLIMLRDTLKWLKVGEKSGFFGLFKAINFLMRFHITANYGSFILGTVYFGAALLIIIIGLRGLKFIPAQEPSLVLFALGLEFSLLVVYAFTLMYGRDMTPKAAIDIAGTGETKSKGMLSREFGKDKEVENLLKAFIMKK